MLGTRRHKRSETGAEIIFIGILKIMFRNSLAFLSDPYAQSRVSWPPLDENPGGQHGRLSRYRLSAMRSASGGQSRHRSPIRQVVPEDEARSISCIRNVVLSGYEPVARV